MKHGLRRGLWLGVGLMALVPSASAGYSHHMRLSSGAKQASMGGTCRALADDASAIFCNPANIAFQEGASLSLDTSLIYGQFAYQDPENTSRTGNEAMAAIGGFGDTYVSHKLADLPIAYGIGVYTYSGVREKYDINSTLLATPFESSNFNLTLLQQRIAPTLAVKLTDYLSVGGSYIRAYQTFAWGTPYQFQNTVQPSALDGVNFYSDLDTDGWGHGGMFGGLVRIGEDLRIGLSYTTQMKVRLQGRNEVTLRNNPTLVGLGVTDGTRTNYNTAMTWRYPQAVATGLTYDVNDRWQVAFDWQWIDWSRAHDGQTYILSEGSNPTVNGVIAAVGGSPDGGIRDVLKQDMKDAFIYQFGAEYRASDRLRLRAGYSYSTNPMRSSTITPIFNGNIQHSISFGAGTTLRGWDVDAAYGHAFVNHQDVATSAIEGGEYNGSETSTGGDAIYLSMKKRF